MNCHPTQVAACDLAVVSDPPSRHNNPFATCWTRPGALAYRFSNGQTAGQLVEKLAAQKWQGAIVGPHGSGKSTLLQALVPALVAAGRHVHPITLRDADRRLPPRFLAFDHRRALVIIDGYEQLAWFKRRRLKRGCGRRKLGLLVTAHEPTNIATLIRLAPDRQLVQQLVADLAAHVSTPITPADVAASHACHGSNVREIFFDLYDRHERLRRARRTDGHQRA
jgi:hypothetical protein